MRTTVGYRGKRQVKVQRTFPKGALMRDIKTWVATEKAQFAASTLPEPSRVKVSELAQQWMVLEKSGMKAQTQKRYRQMLNKPLCSRLGSVPVQRVKSDDLTAVLEMMVARGSSTRTIRYHFEVYRQLFEFAISRGIIKENPVREVRLPKANERSRVEVLEAEQVNSFLEAATASRFYPLFLLLVTTGLRISEALALEWRDIDLEARRLTVARSLDDLYGERRSSSPKSKFAYRNFTMTRRLTEVLSGLPRTGTRVFETSKHPYKSISAELKRLLRAIGAKPLTIHGLRHTACSLMLRSGVNIKVVQVAMGHHSVAFTLDTYAHLLRGEADAVGPALDDALSVNRRRPPVSDTLQTHDNE